MEKVGEGWRRYEKVGESLRKYEKVQVIEEPGEWTPPYGSLHPPRTKA